MCLALVLGVSVRFVNISQVAAEVDWGGGATWSQACPDVSKSVSKSEGNECFFGIKGMN